MTKFLFFLYQCICNYAYNSDIEFSRLSFWTFFKYQKESWYLAIHASNSFSKSSWSKSQSSLFDSRLGRVKACILLLNDESLSSKSCVIRAFFLSLFFVVRICFCLKFIQNSYIFSCSFHKTWFQTRIICSIFCYWFCILAYRMNSFYLSKYYVTSVLFVITCMA